MQLHNGWSSSFNLSISGAGAVMRKGDRITWGLLVIERLAIEEARASSITSNHTLPFYLPPHHHTAQTRINDITHSSISYLDYRGHIFIDQHLWYFQVEKSSPYLQLESAICFRYYAYFKTDIHVRVSARSAIWSKVSIQVSFICTVEGLLYSTPGLNRL